MWKWKDCHWENGKTSTGKMETVLPGICDKYHCGKSLEMEGLPVRNGKCRFGNDELAFENGL